MEASLETTATLSGGREMLVQTSCLRACEGHRKPQTNWGTFGMKGAFFGGLFSVSFLNCSYRCNIEEEYASRLAKLAKAPIGGDEIGYVASLSFQAWYLISVHFSISSELRNSLDILRVETEKQAENHLELANQIRVDLEAHTAEFHSKQVSHRRSIQAPLERKFKEKQAQESYVKKSREKYEGDLMRIEAFTQQATYMQGIDLAKVQQKLNRTKQTIQGNERDYAKFSKDLLDLLVPWEKEWKEYCDSCQDLEEERMDFMKDIIWIYVNLVSTICVHDDQVRPICFLFKFDFVNLLFLLRLVLWESPDGTWQARNRKRHWKLRQLVWYWQSNLSSSQFRPSQWTSWSSATWASYDKISRLYSSFHAPSSRIPCGISGS